MIESHRVGINRVVTIKGISDSNIRDIYTEDALNKHIDAGLNFKSESGMGTLVEKNREGIFEFYERIKPYFGQDKTVSFAIGPYDQIHILEQ